MSLKKNRNQGNSISNSGSPKNQNTTKKVVDIILSSNHMAYNSPEDIGTIFFVEVGFNQDYTDSTSLPSAKPLNKNNFTYPTIGELVQIVESTSNDVYNDLEGDISATTNYYTPAINVHNNTASNALPLENETKKKNPKRESNVKSFEFRKEFKSPTLAVSSKMLNLYLRNLGYASGTNDSNAPKYSLFQEANGDYIYRLDDSADNDKVAVKLGNYFKENPELQPLTPSEGDSIMEGKNGQRIRFTTTGPTGTNAISNNVTDVPDDGNSNIGDKAMVLSLGNGSQENVTNDAASIYMLENQNLPIDATSTNVDSLNSTYTEISDPLKDIAKKPETDIPKTKPNSGTQVQENPFNDGSIGNFLNELNSIQAIPETNIDFSNDPVFAALDESVDEGILTKYEENTYSYRELSSISDPYSAASRPENYTPSDLTEEAIANEKSYSGQLPDSKVPQKVKYKPVFLQPTRKWTLISKRKFAQNVNTFDISDSLKYSVMFVALKEQSTGDNIGGFNHNHYGIMADIGNWSFGSKIIGSISTTEGAGGQGIRTDKFRYFAVFNSTKGGIDFMWNTLKGKGFDNATENNIVDLYIDKWLSPAPAVAQEIKNNKRSTYSKIFNTAKDFINNVT